METNDIQEVLCANNQIGSWLLRFVMASEYSHSAIVDGDLVTHSTFFGGGVKELTLKEFNSHYPIQSQPKSLGIEEDNKTKARQWLKEQVGKPYDWTGLVSIVLQWFTTRSWQEDDSWFCSELTEAVRSLFGKPRFSVNSGWITPKHQQMVL